jgi:hypothetical protein
LLSSTTRIRFFGSVILCQLDWRPCTRCADVEKACYPRKITSGITIDRLHPAMHVSTNRDSHRFFFSRQEMGLACGIARLHERTALSRLILHLVRSPVARGKKLVNREIHASRPRFHHPPAKRY